MIIHYINLDSAVKRRESLSNNFVAAYMGDKLWTLSRFAAIGGDDERVKKIAGSRSDTEKACFLSHHALVTQACSDNDIHWIVEDDVYFSESSFDAVSTFITKHANDDWDILFTDLTIRSFSNMVDLFESRKKIPTGSFTYINVGSCPFCSAVSYIINPKRKEKIMATLKMPEAINKPWDIFLAETIGAGKLTAYFTLPYVTTFSSTALDSQIRSLDSDVPGILGRAFRGLMNANPDLATVNKLLSQIDNGFVDDRAALFGKIISGFLADKFPKK